MLGELHDFGFVNDEVTLFAVYDAVEVHLPDGECLVFIKHGVIEVQVDARFERFVKGPDAIGGENQDALVVF